MGTVFHQSHCFKRLLQTMLHAEYTRYHDDIRHDSPIYNQDGINHNLDRRADSIWGDGLACLSRGRLIELGGG